MVIPEIITLTGGGRGGGRGGRGGGRGEEPQAERGDIF